MTSFIEVSSDQIFVDITKHGAEVSGNKELEGICLSALEKEDYSALFDNLIGTVNDVIQKSKEGDAESFVLVLVQIATKSAKKDENIEVLSKVLSEGTQHAELRTKLLIHVLNATESSSAKHFSLFLRVLQYAQQTKQSLPLDQYLSSIDTLLDNWKVPKNDERRRQVYLLFASILRESGKRKEAYAIYRNYLYSLDKIDDVDNVTEAIKEAIHVAYQFDDLLQIPIIQQLEKSNANLVALLKILNSGSYDEFKQFANTNNVEQISGSTADQIGNKMRLLTLCSLTLGINELPYGTVAQKLQIDENEVEKWVIRAIAANLIDARLNQLEKKVYINKSLHRQFGKNEWQLLQKQLQEWHTSLSNLTKVLTSQRNST
jgi:translation initiation factor 3 subunit M